MVKYPVLHRWDVSPSEAIAIQERLKPRIRIREILFNPRKIAGADAAYNDITKTITAGVVVVKFPEMTLLEQNIITLKTSFPYIPGLLSFREGPALLEAIKNLKHRPEVVIFDGQGIAHPRMMGIATHLGLWLKVPTIGCAKNNLVGNYTMPGIKKGDYAPLKVNGKVCGIVLRTVERVRPVFVSPGHLIGIKSSCQIILDCAQGYRLPEPLRLCHHLVQQAKSYSSWVSSKSELITKKQVSKVG